MIQAEGTRLLYIANIRLPTEKAHGIQIMKMCEAFARNGRAITLVVPTRKNTIIEDPWVFYGIQKNFEIVYLKTPDFVRFGKLGFVVSALYFAERAARFAIRNRFTTIYSRDYFSLLNLWLFRKKLYWEAHNSIVRIALFLLKYRVEGIVVISHGLKKYFLEQGVNNAKLFVAPDGVDLQEFLIAESKEECRKRIGLPSDKTIILYTGHLYPWKGAHLLAEAIQEFDDSNLAVFVGGTNNDIEQFQKEYGASKNISIVGSKRHQEIPYYLKAADVIIVPNSAKTKIGREFTSPLKLFEAMASGTPIVASDVPSIREILNTEMAYFFAPDDEPSLAKTIQYIHSNKKEAEAKAQRARIVVGSFTWNNRAEKLMLSIKKNENDQGDKGMIGRYLIAGSVAALVDILSNKVLHSYIWYLYASMIAFVITFATSFLIQKFWTFRDRSFARMHIQGAFTLFFALGNFILNGALMYFFVTILSIHYLIARIITLGIIALESFFIYRRIFQKPQPRVPKKT